MLKYPRTWNASRGFTLIELVVVIAIIAILAGAIVPTIMQPHLDERSREVHREMTAIEEAIMGRPELGDWGFLSTIGRVPATIDELFAIPTNWAPGGIRAVVNVPRGWMGYLRGASRDPSKDPWGKPYIIVKHTDPALWHLWQIRSNGPNRLPGGTPDDDIYFPSKTDYYNSVGSVRVNLHYTQGNQHVVPIPAGPSPTTPEHILTVNLSVPNTAGAAISKLDRNIGCVASPQKNQCDFSDVPFGLHAVIIDLDPGLTLCGTACKVVRPVRVVKPGTVVDVVLPNPGP